MATIQERIEALGITVDDATYLGVQLDDSAADIIARLPESVLWEAQEEFTDDGTGYDISAIRFLRAHKAGIKAIRVNAYGRALRASGAEYEATTTSPVHYISGGKVHILPGGGTVVGVTLPDVGVSNTTITGWPNGFERVVALHAAMKLKEKDLRDERSNLPTALTSGSLPSVPTDLTLSASAPSAPTAPTISASDVTATGITQTSIGALPTAPDYTKPTIDSEYSTALTAFDTRMSDDDPEMAQQELVKARRVLEEFQQDISNEHNEFQKDLAEYRAGVEKLIEQARLDQQRLIEEASQADTVALANEAQTLRAAIADWEADLGLYSQEIAQYGQEVRAEVSEFSANLQLFSNEIARYSAEIDRLATVHSAALEKFKTTVTTLRAEYADLEERFERALASFIQNHSRSVGLTIQNHVV